MPPTATTASPTPTESASPGAGTRATDHAVPSDPDRGLDRASQAGAGSADAKPSTPLRAGAAPAAEPLGLTRSLADWCAQLGTGDIEAQARTFARHCLLDHLAVTVAGAGEDGVQMLRAEVAGADLQLVPGARGARLIAQAQRSSALNAALVNGTAAHALDFDDVHFDMPGHPTVAIMPALLAVAERDGHTLGDVIDAFVAGVEVACATGRFMTHGHYAQGWHATGTVGAIGAAAGVARLLGMTGDATARAMGLAVSLCGGLKSMFGTMCKPMHAGRAAANGLLAASLAQRGFTARDDMLECAQGFAAAFSGAADERAALDSLGAPHAVRGILFKYHAACYGTHAGIDAMLLLRERHGVQARQVQRVELTVPAENLKICDIKRPTTALEAKFSMTQTAAMALVGVATGDVASYSVANCERDDLAALRERIDVQADPSEFRAVASATVWLDDGETRQATADVSVAETDLVRQRRRLDEKFRLLTATLSDADALATAVLDGSERTPIETVLAGL